MKTAFAYHRYSTEMQRDSYTLEAQRSITKELAKKYECRIIQIYEDEAISGATIEKRPSMLQLLEDLPKLKPNYLISTDQDRLARGNDFWVIKNILSKTKTSIITEKEGVIDQTDITKDALSDMMAVFAKLERKMIGRRVRRAIELKVTKKGEHYGGKPIGYYKKDGKLFVNEIEAKHVGKIFELMASGIGVTPIGKYLEKIGILTPKGKRYSVKTLTRMITNPIYIGKVRIDGSVYPGIHKPIIDKELFRQANLVLEKKRMVNRTKPSKYVLTGYLKCAKCGSNLWGSLGYGSQIIKGKVKKYYKGYVCKNMYTGKCNTKITGKIEDLIFSKILEKIKSLKLGLEDGLSEFIESKMKNKNKVNIQDEIKEIDLKMSRLLDTYLEGVIDLPLYAKKNKELKYHKEHLLKEAQNYENDLFFKDIYDCIRNFNIYNILGDLDFEAKRDLLNLFIKKIEITPAVSPGNRHYDRRVKIDWKI